MIAALAGILLLLLASVSTSPLFESYGADSSFFILVGKGMKYGMLPYRDFFDMKGPVLFFYEYLGQLIPGVDSRTGAWIMQCLWMCIDIFLLDRILRVSNRSLGFFAELILLLPVMIFFAITLDSGNLTEDFSLPFILLTLYFSVKYMVSYPEKPEHPWIYTLCYGACFAVMVFSRITNGIWIAISSLVIAAAVLSNSSITSCRSEMIWSI